MKHEITIRENGTSTKTEAPFIGDYVKKTDIDFATLCAQVATESGLTETQVRAILEGAFAEFIALEKESALRLHVDGFTIGLAISGSFDSSDAAFNPVRNKLLVKIYPDDDITYTLADVTPSIVTPETSAKVRIVGTADEAVERPYDLIHGQHVFGIQGYNLVMTDTGAEVFLTGANGTKYPCTVDEAVSKQLLRVHTNSLLEGGDYKLWVASRGGEAEASLQQVSRNVKYLKVIDPIPTVTGMTDTTGATMAKLSQINDAVLNGTNLTLAAAASGSGYAAQSVQITYQNPDEGAKTVDVTDKVFANTATSITLSKGAAQGIYQDIGGDLNIVIAIKNADGYTCTYNCELDPTTP